MAKSRQKTIKVFKEGQLAAMVNHSKSDEYSLALLIKGVGVWHKHDPRLEQFIDYVREIYHPTGEYLGGDGCNIEIRKEDVTYVGEGAFAVVYKWERDGYEDVVFHVSSCESHDASIKANDLNIVPHVYGSEIENEFLSPLAQIHIAGPEGVKYIKHIWISMRIDYRNQRYKELYEEDRWEPIIEMWRMRLNRLGWDYTDGHCGNFVYDTAEGRLLGIDFGCLYKRIPDYIEYE